MRLEIFRLVRLPILLPAAALAFAWPWSLRGAEPAANALADDGLPRDTILRIHGSATLGAHLIPDLLMPFLKAEGWTDLKRAPAADGNSYTIVGGSAGATRPAGVYVEISDPENALAALDQGFADIAMCTRRVRPAEARQLVRVGELTSPQCEHVVALDAVAVIVNAANPLESLTSAQLRDIFLRRTTSWQELGGSGPIHLYAPEPKSGSSATFQAVVLVDEEFAPDALRLPDNAALADAIASDARGIGFVSLTFAGANRIVAISDGKPEPHAARPNAASIRSGEYPLARRLYFYTGQRPENPLAQKFLNFAISSAGQTIATQGGFVSPTLEPAVPREPVKSLASTSAPPPASSAATAEARPTPEPVATPVRTRVPVAVPTPTPRARAERAETAAPHATPTPRPPRPAVRPSAAPATTPDASSTGTGG